MEKKSKLRALKVVAITSFNLICLFSVIYFIVIALEKNQAISEETQAKVIKEFESPGKGLKPVSGVAETKAGPSAAAQAQQAAQVKQPQEAQPSGDVITVDDFEGSEIRNKIGSKANIYVMAPSRIMLSRRDDVISGKPTKVLLIKYDKKNTGGPGGTGGWCGYYTLIKNEKTGQYLDGTKYKYITFWVRGEKGDENFIVGLADEHWDKIGDSLKSDEIGAYLDKKKITTQWQKAKLPLDIFFLDYESLSSISINFESSCFPEGAGSGVIFIDDIAIEK